MYCHHTWYFLNPAFFQENEVGSVKEESADFLAQFIRAEGLGEVEAHVSENPQIESHIRTSQSEDNTTFPTKKRKLLTTINGDETSASSSGTTWVKCDKCQRTIRLDEFAPHYQEVHAEVTPAEKNSQVRKYPRKTPISARYGLIWLDLSNFYLLSSFSSAE